MKIALIYDYLSEVGGVERVMGTHANWLTRAGHDVTLLFNYVNQKTAEYAFLKGLKIEQTCKFKSGGEPFQVFSGLIGFNDLEKRKNQYDLVIAYSFPSIFTSRKIKCKKAFYYLPMEFIYFPLKKRWEWANDGKRKATFFFSLFLAPILRMLDKKWIKNKLVIANSDFTRKEIRERYNVDSIISYPPLNSVFKPAKSPEKTLKKYNVNKKFILTAGRIVPDKKQDWLVEVFAKLNNKDLDFVIAGQIEEKYKQKLLDTAEKFKVKDKLKLIGLVTQVELVDLYSKSEAFLFASQEEAFGLVPIEAMACGTPVVAWNDDAGPNEYVIDKVNGYLAKPYNLDDFTEKVKKILDEGFKKKNKKRIIESVKKFTEDEQYKSFINKTDEYTKK
ncbi:glycosyltransferase family 4 protein [Candidatus Pacearchaeota archaeon]|nr:glycosyltransferase family 4 protein [Candidatus Pacearchaeota archaeon]